MRGRFEAEVVAWRRAEEIREFVAAIRTAVGDAHGSIEPESDLGKGLEWAELASLAVCPDPIRLCGTALDSFESFLA
jgi:hypothetical protein